MITLTMGNSICTLSGLSSMQLSKLRRACSYTITTGRRVRYRTKKGEKPRWGLDKVPFHLMEPKGDFPTGIMYIVEDCLKANGWRYRVLDARICPRLHSVSETSLYLKKKFEPYPEQREAAMAALEHGRGIIVGPTGVGKSAICELIVDAFRVPTLIVVPTLELKRQLTETLRGAFGELMVGPMGKHSSPRHPISVENVDALDPKKRLVGVDCVIIDEFHHSAAISYRELNRVAWRDVYYKIGLTATPFRSNMEERKALESVLAQVIYEIPYSLAVERGYIVPLEAYYVDLPKKEDPTTKGGWKKKSGTKVTYAESYTRDVVNNDIRNDIIASMVANLKEAGKSTLVLTKHIAHGNVLQEILDSLGHPIPFAEGTSELKSEDIAAFNCGDEVALIGTTGVLGEGVDTKPAEWVILAGGGKSKNQFMQNVGRVFRKYPGKESGKVVLIRDASNKWLLEHFNKCLGYLRDEYGVVAEKLDLGT